LKKYFYRYLGLLVRFGFSLFIVICIWLFPLEFFLIVVLVFFLVVDLFGLKHVSRKVFFVLKEFMKNSENILRVKRILKISLFLLVIVIYFFFFVSSFKSRVKVMICLFLGKIIASIVFLFLSYLSGGDIWVKAPKISIRVYLRFWFFMFLICLVAFFCAYFVFVIWTWFESF